MIKDKRLKRFMERIYCDKCEDELVLKSTDFCTDKGVIYKYICTTCDNKTASKFKYPRIIEKEID